MSEPQTKNDNPKTTEEAIRKNLERKPEERGGQEHEPTRFGDWESNGRCTDF